MTTFPDKVFELGGKPVSGGYGAMWSGKTFFVDYDNGTAGASGTSIRRPQKNLETILTGSDFSAGDVIYIRPASPSQTGYVGDPTPITPATAANWIIAAADYGVSLIGTGVGVSGPAAHFARLQGHASVTDAPTLDIRAPYVNIENLGFRRGASTAGIVRAKYVDSTTYAGATYHAFGVSLSNCHFRLGQAVGALILDSSWYSKVLGCTFSSCSVGIMLSAGNSNPCENVIADCDFIALASEVTADINTTGVVTRVLMRNLFFNHAVPTGGSPNQYINIASASTGLVANCYTGAVDPTVADNMTLNGVLYSHIYGDGVGPFVDA